MSMVLQLLTIGIITDTACRSKEIFSVNMLAIVLFYFDLHGSVKKDPVI